MDLVQPPTKPPRGVKNSKETSGLLMTVIRTLSTSDSNEQRDQERTKLERDYKKSNQQLEELVSIHHDDLTRVMSVFGRLSTLISNSKERVHASKENLLACKKLLTCRREELKKLWLESTEYKYTLQLLLEIEQIKEVSSQVDHSFTQKDFLPATRSLMSAINTSETKLKDVVGLQELRAELQLKKQEAYVKLVKEMKEQIYIQSTHEIIALKRQGSARGSTDLHSSPAAHRPERKISSRQNRYKSKKLLDISNTMSKTQNDESVQFSDDPEYIISKLIECIVMFDKGVDFLEELKQSTQRELANLIARTTKELSTSDSPNILLEFLNVLMEQFKRVIDCHTVVLDTFKNKHNINSVYDLPNVWLKMQSLLQPLISQYVEGHDKKKAEVPAVDNNDKIPVEQYDVNSYFTRKKQQRTIKGSLFKFDNSAQNDGIQKAFEKDGGKDTQLLCKPSASYITQLYVPVSRFAEEIELQIHGNNDKTSKLNIFLNELISHAFVGKKYDEIINELNLVDKNGVTLPSKETHSSPSNPLMTALTTSLVYTHVQ